MNQNHSVHSPENRMGCNQYFFLSLLLSFPPLPLANFLRGTSFLGRAYSASGASEVPMGFLFFLL